MVLISRKRKLSRYDGKRRSWSDASKSTIGSPWARSQSSGIPLASRQRATIFICRSSRRISIVSWRPWRKCCSVGISLGSNSVSLSASSPTPICTHNEHHALPYSNVQGNLQLDTVPWEYYTKACSQPLSDSPPSSPVSPGPVLLYRFTSPCSPSLAS